MFDMCIKLLLTRLPEKVPIFCRWFSAARVIGLRLAAASQTPLSTELINGTQSPESEIRQPHHG